MRIEVNYNPDNPRCATLEHFEKNWIHNQSLHPKVKEIPYSLVESDEDVILLLDDGLEILEYFKPLALDQLDIYLREEWLVL